MVNHYLIILLTSKLCEKEIGAASKGLVSVTYCSRDKITSVFSWPLIARSRSPDFPKDFPNDGSLSPQMSNAQYHSHLYYVQIWHSAPKAPPIFPHPESDRSGIWELLGRECRVTSLTFPLLYCLLCLGSGSLALHNVYSCCHGGPALLRFHSFKLYREHAAHLQRSARLCSADGN